MPTSTTGERTVDLTGFAGHWVSSDAQSRGIPAFALTVNGQEVRARCFGAGPDGLVDWGERIVTQIFTGGVRTAAGAGFALRYDFGFMETHLQVNLKLGVAVLGAFNTFKDGSGRRPYFAREFYAQSHTEAQAISDSDASLSEPRISRLQDLDFGVAGPGGTVDPALLLGRWHNTVPTSGGIAEISLVRQEAARHETSSAAKTLGAAKTMLRVHGAGEDGAIDWGEVEAQVFTCVEENGIPSICMLAVYDFDFMQCALQIRQNKGILAVTTFNVFGDGSGRFDYVTRELFYCLAAAT